MVPVGGQSLGVATAVEVISQIEPGIVVPMHYATGNAAVPPPPGLETLEKFSREIGLHEPATRDRLTVRRADIPEDTQVVVLTDRGA
jgi:hypothetical protein